MTDISPTRPVAGLPPAAPAKPELRAVAEKLEASFLAEMLKSAGVGEQDNSFSGSPGEQQFASFQREALAREMVANGGMGLADVFHAALQDKIEGQDR